MHSDGESKQVPDARSQELNSPAIPEPTVQASIWMAQAIQALQDVALLSSRLSYPLPLPWICQRIIAPFRLVEVEVGNQKMVAAEERRWRVEEVEARHWVEAEVHQHIVARKS